MGSIPTVKVVHGDGYMVINKPDFDPEIHELYDEVAAKAKEKKGSKEKEPPAEPKEAPPGDDGDDSKDGDDGDSGEPKDDEPGDLVLETEHAGHGWYIAKVNDTPLMKDDGKSPIKFKGEAAAKAALEEYAASQKE